MLTVIAIIAVLAGISFGVLSGVKRRAAEAKARGELAVLAQALEDYKRQYGDYPQTGASNNALTAQPAGGSDANVRLLNALSGLYGPKLDPMHGKSFLELARFTLESGEASAQPDPSATAVLNALIDPWGSRYVYCYKTVGSVTWKAPSYVLYSVGPDGSKAQAEADCHTPPAADGTVDLTATGNADNIYANQ